MATEPISYQTEMYNLLDAHTTKKYYIEYEGFMANHISQGVYALEQLQAPLSRALQFIGWNADHKLEKAEEHQQRQLKEDPQPENVDELIGKQKSFYYLYEYYQELLNTKYESSLQCFIAGEFPKLCTGLIGSALHGIIHLGYGYASRRDWFVCEGMAYLHHSSIPLNLSNDAPGLQTLGLGSMSVLDVLEEISQDKTLIEYMLEGIKVKEIADRITSNFQRKSYVLFRQSGDILAKYVHKIQFPSGLNSREFHLDQSKELAKWLVDCAITVYAITKNPNDFFLLHGVTGSWGVKNILPLLDDINTVLETTRTTMCTLLATYLCQQCPALNRNLVSQTQEQTYGWEELMKWAAEHDQYGDEHVYKIVQVCHDMSQENQDPTMESLYQLASYRCLTKPFINMS